MRPTEFSGEDTEPASDWLTLGQASKYMGVAQTTVRKWADQGRLPTFYTPGGHRRFQRSAIDAFIGGTTPVRRGLDKQFVLLVNDKPQFDEHLRRRVKDAGYDVREAASGEEALALIEDHPPQLVLVDVAISGVDGWRLLLELHDRHGSIPTIVYDCRRPGELATDLRSPQEQSLGDRQSDLERLLRQTNQ
jgi:excisionase family DNA binding protein